MAQVLFAGMLWLAAQAAAAPEPVLRAGAVVESQLQAGARDSYRAELSAGDFLHVVVEQRALDVVLHFVDPDGAVLMDADSRNGAFGFERVAFIAKRSGTYRLEVRSGAGAPAGAYVLQVRALRPATASDVGHEAAERAHLDADLARRRNDSAGRAQAFVKYREAAEGFKALGLEYEYALTLFSSGVTHLEAGESRAAAADLDTALPIVEKRQDQLLPSVLNALGGAYDIFGELDRAMASYREALAFFRQHGNRNGEAAALNNIGKLYADMADWQRALEQYRAAVPVLRAQGNRRTLGVALMNIGVAIDHLGDSAQALDYLGQSLDERRAVGDRRQEAVTLEEMGRAWVDLGEPDRALALLDRALALNRASADRRNEAQSLGTTALAYAALKQPDRAIDLSRQALDIFRAIGDRNNAAAMSFVAARAERDLGRLDLAARDAEDAVAAIEQVRGQLSSAAFRTTYFAGQHDVSMFLVDLLMRRNDREPGRGYDLRAMEVSERARARSLLDSLAEAGARVSRGADPDLVAREQRITQQLDVKAERLLRLAGRPAAAEAAALERDIRGLEAEYDEVRTAIRRKSPAYAALTDVPSVNVSEIQRTLLDDGTLLLQYSLGPEASYLWAVDRERVSSYRLPPANDVADAVRAVHTRVAAKGRQAVDAGLNAAIAALSAMVLGPARDRLQTASRVAVVPDGALQYVPFAMLTPSRQSGAAPLVVHADVVVLPSASALSAQRAQSTARVRPSRGIAVLADPVFDARDPRVSSEAPGAAAAAAASADAVSSDETRILAHLTPGDEPAGKEQVPRLPFTRVEAAAILRAARSSRNLEAEGFDATKALVLSGALAPYRFVHLATHGIVDAEHPDLSAIVLSLVDRDGRRRDGFLRARDIYNLDLPADLVVLSACETGLGREIRGEGILGLTRGFMYAGAPRVVVSLWSVSDRATAALMAAFYRAMLEKGETPAAALRSAQLTMMKQRAWRHPYFWAGFVIEGDWK